MADPRDTATTRKRYHGEAVDVSFDGTRCRHAAECLRGLPAVFDVGRRPWIDPDRAGPDELIRVVARCPTGALRTHPKSGPEEEPAVPTEATAIPGGPLLLRGDLHVQAEGVDEHETRAALESIAFQSAELIEAMAAQGMGGLEVDHPDHDDEQRARYRAMAERIDLVPTGASDCHGARYGYRLGCETTPLQLVDELERRRGR